MEYSKLIHDFLDGTLDTQQENELFMMISSNDEVRAEFKHSLTLDRALNKKLSSFTPSAKSTVGLFSQLGFTAPASLSSGPKPPGAIKSTLKKYSQGMAGAASMAVVSIIAFLLIETGGGNSEIQNNSIANSDLHSNNNLHSNNTAEISDLPAKKTIPVVESYSDEQIPHQAVRNENYKKDNFGNDNKTNENNRTNNYRKNNFAKSIRPNPPAAMNNPDRPKNPGAMNTNVPATQPDITDNAQNKFPDGNLLEGQAYYLAPNISQSDAAANQTPMRLNHAVDLSTVGFVNVIEPPPYDNYIEPVGLSVAIHGNEYWQLQPKSLPESTIPKFSNMGLTVFYDVSGDLSLGFDVRQEHFYQEFTVAGDDGIDYLYQQTPNYITYSGVVKYDLYQFDYMAFFAQSMAGMTATGGVWRFMAGAEYSPNDAYTFSLGLEYSELVFKNNYDVRLYNAPKLGFNYSVIVKL